MQPRGAVWRDLGHLVGWLAVAIGLAGVILHLDSHFFYERTIKSLVYAAPFAAPLAYTGLGLLLVMNRMVAADSREWPLWVLLMALGGFVGNFLFSLTGSCPERLLSLDRMDSGREQRLRRRLSHGAIPDARHAAVSLALLLACC